MDLKGEEIFLYEDLNIYKLVDYQEKKRKNSFDVIFTIEKDGQKVYFNMDDLRYGKFIFLDIDKQSDLIQQTQFAEFPYLLRYHKDKIKEVAIDERIAVYKNFIFCIQYGCKCSVLKYIGDSDRIEIPEKIEGMLVEQIGYTKPGWNDYTDEPYERSDSEGERNVKNNSFVLNKKQYRDITIPRGIKNIIKDVFKDLEVKKVIVDIENEHFYTTNTGACLIQQMSEPFKSYNNHNKIKLPLNGFETGHDILVYGTDDALIPLYIYRINEYAFAHIRNREDLKDRTIYIPSDNNPYYALLNYEDNEQVITIHPDCKILLQHSLKGKLTKQIKLPDGLLIIQNKAVSNCPNITELDIPCTVKYAESDLFSKCENIKILKFGIYLVDSFIETKGVRYGWGPLRPAGRKEMKYICVVKKEKNMDDNGSFSFTEYGIHYEFFLGDDGEYKYKSFIKDEGKLFVSQKYDRVLKELNEKLKRINDSLYYNDTINTFKSFLFFKGQYNSQELDTDRIKNNLEKKYDPEIVKEWIKEPLCRYSAYLCILDYILVGKDIYLNDEYWDKLSKFQLEKLIGQALQYERVDISSKLIVFFNQKYGDNGDIHLD